MLDLAAGERGSIPGTIVFFYASKIFSLFATPSTTLITCLVVGFALRATGLARLSHFLMAVAATGIVVFGTGVLPQTALRVLENRIARFRAGCETPTGVIVLGGVAKGIRGEVALYEPGRVIGAVQLATQFPMAKLLFSGGDASLVGDRGAEAEAAVTLFQIIGIPLDRVLWEGRSRNTRENAVFTRDLLRPGPSERWILVTSAYHMPRAVGAFRAVGMEVEPYPVDFRTTGTKADYLPRFGEFPKSLADSDLAVKEWLGLIAYRMAGYTAALFPSPRQDSQPLEAAGPDETSCLAIRPSARQ